MSNILPSGSLNPNSIIAPGVYVLAKLPKAPVTGVETDTILTVGTASWGPVNAAVVVGSLQEQVSAFGVPTTEVFDMGTQVYGSTSVGAASFLGLRVTDGSDAAASVLILDDVAATGMTIDARYTGTIGNTLSVTITDGTNTTVALPTFKITLLFPTGTGDNIPEVYDNIGGTGAALWQSMVDAINLGQGAITPPSEVAIATLGVGTGAPDLSASPYTLAGGLNGNSGVVAADLVGSNVLPLTGMYAASEKDFSLMVLAGVTEETTYIAQADFAANQGAYAILARPFGEPYADAITAKKTVGLVNYSTKLMVGETWIKIEDGFNNIQRYISQQGLVAGELSTLPPQASGLNKPITSTILVSTYFSDQHKSYSQADIVTILLNGLDTVANPSPGGFFWALQTGKNTSDNLLANGDQFTRLTNFLAASIEAALGKYVGTLQSPSQRLSIKTEISSFLNNLADQEVIGSTLGGQPFTVVIDDSNNPASQVAKGIEVVDINVAFFQVVVALLVNLQTGLVTVAGIAPQ